MRKIVFFILLSILAVTEVVTAQVQTMQWQDRQREYIVRTPSIHDGTPPVVFLLHGLTDKITQFDANHNLSQLADDFGWVIVSPQAVESLIGTMWNVGFMNTSVDDAGFLMALLDTVALNYGTDPDSVFFSGFSMGGFMTHKLAIEHGDRITACAPVSGLITDELAAITPVVPVKMLHVHGTNDYVVGYDGNSSVFSMSLGIGVDAIANYWRDANSCVSQPVIDSLPDTKNDGLRFVRYSYSGNREFQLMKVIGGSHIWYNNAALYDASYFDIIRDFFVGSGSGVGISANFSPKIVIRPNPASDRLIIESDGSSAVCILDMAGRVLRKFETVDGNNILNISDIPAGFYILRSDSGEITKFVISR